jgi:hypothetical protein
MGLRTIMVLVAILVTGLTLVATAGAEYQYDWRACPGATDECDGIWEVYPQWVQPGEIVTLHIDFDEISPGLLSSIDFWLLYPPGQLTFRDVRREQIDPSSPIACRPGINTGGYIPPNCPHCTAQVECSVADWFFNGGLDLVGPAEVEIEFVVTMTNQPNQVTMVAPDWFVPLDENASNLNGPNEGYPVGPTGIIFYVPEPGQYAMLGAGVPLLVFLGGRRARRNQ